MGKTGEEMRIKIVPTPDGSQSSPSRIQDILVSPEILEEWLHTLARQNEFAVKNSSVAMSEQRCDSGTIQFLFLCCDKLKVSREMKYLAVEIFDRFLPIHVESLIAQVKTLSPNSCSWEYVEKRLHKQVVLRMISSIQLASKLNSHYKNLTPSDVKSFLQEAGYFFNADSILSSELRIMETLKYKINFTSPLTYLEVIIQVLVHNDPTTDYKHIRELSVKLLDVIYVNRDNVYRKLCEALTGESADTIPPLRRKALAGVKADYMLLATATIAVAANMIDKGLYKTVAAQLRMVSGIKRRDIYTLGLVIMELISVDDE